MVDTNDPNQLEHQEMDVLSVRLLATNPGSQHITSQTKSSVTFIFLSALAKQNIVMSIDHYRNIYIYRYIFIYTHVVMPWGVLRAGVSTAD